MTKGSGVEICLVENERRNGCYRIRLKKTVAGKEKREDFDMIAFLNWLDGVLWGVPLIALMILTGLYFTVRSGFSSSVTLAGL